MLQHYCLLDTLVLINNAFDLSKFVMGLLFKNEKEKEDWLCEHQSHSTLMFRTMLTLFWLSYPELNANTLSKCKNNQRDREMWLPGHLWQPILSCPCLNYERIFIKKTFNFSKLNLVSLLIFFTKKNKEWFSEHSHLTVVMCACPAHQ